MNVFIARFLFGLLVGFAGPAYANIYSWTGDDGVLYFSDKPNSPNAKVFIKVDPEPIRAQVAPVQIQKKPVEDDEWDAKLDAANAKLDEALDRVETLTEQVETAESKAAASAAEAARAAQDAADQANQASESGDDSYHSRGVVYYGAPYYYKNRHKHRLAKPHHRDRSHKNFKNRFRSGGRNHGAFAKQKHQMNRRPHRDHDGRGGTHIKKGNTHFKERLNKKRHSNKFVDRKFKNFYRRPSPANSIGRSARSFGRN